MRAAPPSLRRHYPVQVLRVESLPLSSQPEEYQAPRCSHIQSIVKSRQFVNRLAFKFVGCAPRFIFAAADALTKLRRVFEHLGDGFIQLFEDLWNFLRLDVGLQHLPGGILQDAFGQMP